MPVINAKVKRKMLRTLEKLNKNEIFPVHHIQQKHEHYF